MSITCPICDGTKHLPDLIPEVICYNCEGTGQVKSKRQEEWEWNARRKAQLEEDRAAPFVTIRVQLPMLGRELDKVGEVGLVSVRDVLRVLEHHITK